MNLQKCSNLNHMVNIHIAQSTFVDVSNFPIKNWPKDNDVKGFLIKYKNVAILTIWCRAKQLHFLKERMLQLNSYSKLHLNLWSQLFPRSGCPFNIWG